VLQPSPARSEQPLETLTLLPMGAARLRISAFPTIGSGPDAHQWVAPAAPHKSEYAASASFTCPSDTLDALGDGLIPAASNDESIPRFTWWDHRGTTEWVQYDFPQPKVVSVVNVYWFDDTGKGECRVPNTWRVLYQDGGDWKLLPGAGPAAGIKDQFNTMTFAPVKTSALRIEAGLQHGFSGGILEWQVK